MPHDTHALAPTVVVPANSSRFMATAEKALAAPTAHVTLGWSDADPYVRNLSFDASLIAHDEDYCTSVVNIDGVPQIPTTRYFATEVLPHAPADPRITDIGCGQGEFVGYLRSEGINAVGYDPVAQRETPFIRRRYWTPEESSADVFVMRCVLPHIPDPWGFLTSLGQANPGALVLVEFQRLEWILANRIWFQVSHDHVNVFSVDDFESRFDVVATGSFSDGEWAWVLLRADTYRPAPQTPCRREGEVAALMSEREQCMAAAASFDRPLAIWGAAGKGIVLAHGLLAGGAKLTAAIDADRVRHGRYLEVSGLRVYAPSDAGGRIPDDALVLVCNPNHLDEITASKPRWEIASAASRWWER